MTVGTATVQLAPAAEPKRPSLQEARSDYHAAVEHRRQAERAYDRCKLDCDNSSYSLKAAQSYLAGGDATDAERIVDKAAGARAALPALRLRLREAITAEELSRGSFRAALISIVAEKLVEKRDEYVRAAGALRSSYVQLVAQHRLLTKLQPHAAPLHAPVLNPISAVLPEGVRPTNSLLPTWLVEPDAIAHENAAHARSIEMERDLRHLAGDGWPFDPQGVPNFRLND